MAKALPGPHGVLKSEVLGVAELQKTLRKLPEELRRNALTAVSRAGAQALQRAAYAQLAIAMRSRTPRAEDVVIAKRRAPKEHVQAMHDVGPPKRRPQLRWLHTGTASHFIGSDIRYSRTRQNKFSKTDSRFLADVRSDRFFGRFVRHPGQPATLWLLRAQHMSVDAVMRAMGEKLREALPKQVRKLASRKYSGRLLKRIVS